MIRSRSNPDPTPHEQTDRYRYQLIYFHSQKVITKMLTPIVRVIRQLDNFPRD